FKEGADSDLLWLLEEEPLDPHPDSPVQVFFCSRRQPLYRYIYLLLAAVLNQEGIPGYFLSRSSTLSPHSLTFEYEGIELSHCLESYTHFLYDDDRVDDLQFDWDIQMEREVARVDIPEL
ncbi:MAG: hypothetical protein ABEJ65_02560, partial [bacterium]